MKKVNLKLQLEMLLWETKIEIQFNVNNKENN